MGNNKYIRIKDSSIGGRLRHFRVSEVRCSRERFVEGFNVTPRTLERYENGETSPDASFLSQLCHNYNPGLNLDWLVLGRGHMLLEDPAIGHYPRVPDMTLLKMQQQLNKIYEERDPRKLSLLANLLGLLNEEGELGQVTRGLETKP